MRWVLALALVGSGCSRDFTLLDAGGPPCQVTLPAAAEEGFDPPDGGFWTVGDRSLRAVDSNGQDLLFAWGPRLLRRQFDAGRWTAEWVDLGAECFEVRGVPGRFGAVCDADAGTLGAFERVDGGWAVAAVDPGRNQRDGSARILARRELIATGPAQVALSTGDTRPLTPPVFRMLGVTEGATRNDDVFVGLIPADGGSQIISYPPAIAGRPEGQPGALAPACSLAFPSLPSFLFGLFDRGTDGVDLRPLYPQPRQPPPEPPGPFVRGVLAPAQHAVVPFSESGKEYFAFAARGPSATRRLFLAWCDQNCTRTLAVATDLTMAEEVGVLVVGNELLVVSATGARRFAISALSSAARQQCGAP